MQPSTSGYCHEPNVMKVSETTKAWCIHSISNTYRQHEC